MIDLDEKHLENIKKILNIYISDYEVRAFGSRVDGTSLKYSDLDLAIIGEKPLSLQLTEQLKDAFSHSDLPIMVDILEWNNLSDRFKKIIERTSIRVL